MQKNTYLFSFDGSEKESEWDRAHTETVSVFSRRALLDEGWQRFLRPFFFFSAFFSCFYSASVYSIHWSSSLGLPHLPKVRIWALALAKKYSSVDSGSRQLKKDSHMCVPLCAAHTREQCMHFSIQWLAVTFRRGVGLRFALNEFYLQFVATKANDGKGNGCSRIEANAEIGNHFGEKMKEKLKIITVPVASLLPTHVGCEKNYKFYLISSSRGKRSDGESSIDAKLRSVIKIELIVVFVFAFANSTKEGCALCAQPNRKRKSVTRNYYDFECLNLDFRPVIKLCPCSCCSSGL